MWITNFLKLHSSWSLFTAIHHVKFPTKNVGWSLVAGEDDIWETGFLFQVCVGAQAESKIFHFTYILFLYDAHCSSSKAKKWPSLLYDKILVSVLSWDLHSALCSFYHLCPEMNAISPAEKRPKVLAQTQTQTQMTTWQRLKRILAEHSTKRLLRLPQWEALSPLVLGGVGVAVGASKMSRKAIRKKKFMNENRHSERSEHVQC